ncbi:GapR family DNA-binding domain-containing protein [Brucella sp. NF 2815]|uniref:GapR family DNA-binding domain-containing protein n=1 Tax=Brucella sp. NF 2815 TaxID=3419592 RepID=UPI003D17EC55
MSDDITSEAQTIAVGQLRAFIERIERLEEEKKTIGDDIKEVYAELKGSGFDSKVVRTIIRLRKKKTMNVRKKKPCCSSIWMHLA